MRSYLFNRLLQGVLVVWVLVTIIFVAFRLLPTDPTVLLADSSMAPEARQKILEEFGLNLPIYQQYILYIKNIILGNFGNSFYYKLSSIDVVLEATINTLVIVIPAIIFGSIIGCLLGIYIGWMKRNSFWEQAAVTVATILRGTPSFIVGLLVLICLSFWTGWFPVGGMREPGLISADAYLSGHAAFDIAWHAVLPILTVVLVYIPETLLIMRTAIIETRGEDYLDFIKATGASNRRVMYHAARNSLLPVTTWIFVSVGNLISGIAVVETVFSWPGIGRELVLSVSRLDYPVAQAAFFLMAIIVVFMNILTDLIYAYIDPRVILTK